MACCRRNAWRLWVIALLSALAASGCANMDFPRIDPTGQRIFLPQTYPPAYASPAPIYAPPVVSTPPLPGSPTLGSSIAPTPAPSPAPAGVTVRVTGPAQSTVGATVTYRIEVTNAGSASARQIVVTGQPPAGLNFLNSNPQASSSAGNQQWQIPELAARQALGIEANYRVAQAGTLNYCATALADGASAAKDCVATTASESPLSAGSERIEIQVVAPQTAMVGDEVKFEIRVSNTGTAAASGLLISDRLDPGLEHSSKVNLIERDLADIAAGDSTRIGLSLHVSRAGQLCQDIQVLSGGRVLASNRHCLQATGAPSAQEDSSAQPPTGTGAAPPAPPPTSSAPRLTVSKKGPTQRKVGEIAEFTIEVTNNGSVPVTNIRITDNYELTLEPVQATRDYEIVGGSLVWMVKSLEPGKLVRREVHCQCLKATAQACNRVTVTADPGLTLPDAACLTILPAAGTEKSTEPSANASERSASKPELASDSIRKLSLQVNDQEDPLRVDADTAYQIVLKNESDTAQRNVTVSVTIPVELTLLGSTGPVRAAMEPRGIRYQPIAELRQGESVTFDVRVKANQSGMAKLQVQATSEDQKTATTAAEATQIIAK